MINKVIKIMQFNEVQIKFDDNYKNIFNYIKNDNLWVGCKKRFFDS